EVKLVLIDPKKVEFSVYNGIPHLLVPVVTDPQKAAGALGWAVIEMNKRYQEFSNHKVRDLTAYNEKAKKSEDMEVFPQILVVIDEFSDLMMNVGSEVEESVVRIAQMGRAAGIHMVIATQRPSANVITGLIKANIPSRIALSVSQALDSRLILDTNGAETLLGHGDMLFLPIGASKPLRLQGCYVSDAERENVIRYISPDEEQTYDEETMNEINRLAETGNNKTGASVDEDEENDVADEMLPKAIEAVIDTGEASVSLLQRKLRVGYARAGRLIDEMERKGIVGPHEGSKPRKVLLTREQWLEMSMNDEEV
ncbi:MAG: DNA translocase FtsK, partial [Clostridia bacterium]|nr:DNA translocase FtsK [Clostridia bacterium]